MRLNGEGFEFGEPEYPDGKPLYRLHELAARPHDPVIVVEGEWCAHALAKADALATTSGAADSAGKADWRPLAGGEVVIWPDNDEPGRRYADALADALLALDCTVRVTDVEKLGLPRKGDAVDWLKANPAATAADIAALPCVEARRRSTAGETNEQAVARLASMKPMDYDRVRQAEADALGVRVATLDVEVARTRAALNPGDDAGLQGQAPAIDEPGPWPDEVDGAEVLNDTADALTMYLALPDGAADVMALWGAHAHCHTAFLHSPRLNITAPEKGCGKTLTLDVLHWLVPKAIRTEGITTAVLFRLVDKYAPTLLVDEYDAFIHHNEELRGALNAGHKRGGMHLRCEGDKNEVRGFRTFAPVALAPWNAGRSLDHHPHAEDGRRRAARAVRSAADRAGKDPVSQAREVGERQLPGAGGCRP